MNKFGISDEKTHQQGPHKYWNESFYMNFFDVDSGWGGASRISFFPNQKFSDGFICLFLPDNTTGFIRVWEDCEIHLDQSSSGLISHECLDPFKSWRVTYKGPIFHFEEPAIMGDFARTMLTDLPKKEIELEIEFEAVHDIFDFHDSMKKEMLPVSSLLNKLKPGYFLNHLGPAVRKVKMLKTMSGAQHYEHAGNIKGKIVLDGIEHNLKGFGQRDHSWGVRDMLVLANWRWFSGQFGDELCFNAIKVEVLGFRASGGYVFHDGKPKALKDWKLRSNLDESGLWAKDVSLELVDSSGNKFNIEGCATANIPVVVNNEGYACVVNEARANFSWEGKTGYGISEFMEQLI